MAVKDTTELPDPVLPDDNEEESQTDLIFWRETDDPDSPQLCPRLDLTFDTQAVVPHSWVHYHIEACRTLQSVKVDLAILEDVTDEQYMAATKLGWFKTMRRAYLERQKAKAEGDPKGAKQQARKKKVARGLSRLNNVSSLTNACVR
jgi:hypothetical protein